MKRSYSTMKADRTIRSTRKPPRKYVRAGPSPVVSTYPASLVPYARRGYTPNNVEKKVYDTDATSTTVNTTGSITLLFNPALGTDMTNRVGRKTMIKSIFIRGFMDILAAETPVTGTNSEVQQGRLMLVWDTQPNGAIATIANILKQSTSYSQLNMDNRDRFKIIKEKVVICDPMIYNTTATQSVAMCGRTGQNVKIYKKCNLETIFNGTNGGTIADIQSGALLLVLIGSTANGANVNMGLNWTCRVRFNDQ